MELAKDGRDGDGVELAEAAVEVARVPEVLGAMAWSIGSGGSDTI